MIESESEGEEEEKACFDFIPFCLSFDVCVCVFVGKALIHASLEDDRIC